MSSAVPIGDSSADLMAEINRLKQENERLREDSFSHQDKAISLAKEVERLENRFGLVWPYQKEHFLKVVSDTEIVYKNKLWSKSGMVTSSKGSKAEVELDDGNSVSLVRGNEPYLYADKISHKEYLCHGGHVHTIFKDIVGKYLPTLVPKAGGDKEWGFDDKNGERKHILIEGDNYHALQVLQHTHRGAVDVIYIDVPYNTGNKDFKYNDRFVSEDDGSRHSSWLSFMERRLLLAKQLLSKDSFIAISIDDKEINNLKLLNDKIFGELNHISTVVVKSSTPSGVKTSHKDKKIIKQKEYVLIYKKGSPRLTPQYKKKLGWDSHYGYFMGKDMNLMPLKDVLINEGILKKGQSTKDIEMSDKMVGFIKKYHGSVFRTAPTMPEDIREISRRTPTDVMPYKDSLGRVQYAYSGNRLTPLTASLKSCDGELALGVLQCDFWDDIDYQNTQNEGCGVSFPSGRKPLKLMKRLLSLLGKDNSVALDFFAGSGTTGHAVWELNKEDGGNRQVILCTNNESNICEDVTYERMHRCNLPQHGDYQEGLEYLQIRHVSAEEFRQADRTKSLEHIKHIINLRHNASKVIEDNENWYATNTICVLKSPRYVDEFFKKFKSHSAFALVDNKPTKFQIFKERAASYGISPDKLHWLSKEYISDLLLSASVED